MKLSIEISQSQAELLRRAAERLGVSCEDLAQAALHNFLSGPPSNFQTAAEHAINKNRALYRRLSE